MCPNVVYSLLRLWIFDLAMLESLVSGLIFCRSFVRCAANDSATVSPVSRQITLKIMCAHCDDCSVEEFFRARKHGVGSCKSNFHIVNTSDSS
jgi:hypothetical protein